MSDVSANENYLLVNIAYDTDLPDYMKDFYDAAFQRIVAFLRHRCPEMPRVVLERSEIETAGAQCYLKMCAMRANDESIVWPLIATADICLSSSPIVPLKWLAATLLTEARCALSIGEDAASHIIPQQPAVTWGIDTVEMWVSDRAPGSVSFEQFCVNPNDPVQDQRYHAQAFIFARECHRSTNFNPSFLSSISAAALCNMPLEGFLESNHFEQLKSFGAPFAKTWFFPTAAVVHQYIRMINDMPL